MSQSPLLGNRISLISKKNIRYEGILYSINEANSTLALQNVTSFGTEGREKTDPSTAFVAPQEGVHPYLLFRGCDIKDLHVHEQATAGSDATKTESKSSSSAEAEQPTKGTDKTSNDAAAVGDLPSPPPVPAKTSAAEGKKDGEANGIPKKERSSAPRRSNTTRRNTAAVGTGASLLNRKARGAVQGGDGPEKPEGDFDFQAKLEEFDKESDDAEKVETEDNDEAGDEIAYPQHNEKSYEKDDFFDSISCDALDKQSGVDNRLRGKEERNLNMDTFGATALNSHRRRRGRGGGRGYNNRSGGRGGNYSGRGGGRGRGRGGRGRSRNNNSKRNTPQGGKPVESASS